MTGAMSKHSSQLNVLFERNLAVLLGSLGRLWVLLLQQPLIGALIGLAWDGTRATDMTYFILALAAFYRGVSMRALPSCVNAPFMSVNG